MRSTDQQRAAMARQRRIAGAGMKDFKVTKRAAVRDRFITGEHDVELVETTAESRMAGLGGQFAKGGGRVPAQESARKWVSGQDEEEAMVFATNLYDGIHGSKGYASSVDTVRITFEGALVVNGSITAGSKKIGKFERRLVPDIAGTPGGRRMDPNTGLPKGSDPIKAHVSHELLELDEDRRGTGFSQEFNARAEAGYKEAGYAEVHLTANIDVGGYAWARQGYVPTPKATKDLFGRITERRSEDPHRPENHLTAQDADALGGFLSSGNMNGVATYKNAAGEPTGKTFLLGSHWKGVKNLQPPTTESRMAGLGGQFAKGGGRVLGRNEQKDAAQTALESVSASSRPLTAGESQAILYYKGGLSNEINLLHRNPSSEMLNRPVAAGGLTLSSSTSSHEKAIELARLTGTPHTVNGPYVKSTGDSTMSKRGLAEHFTRELDTATQTSTVSQPLTVYRGLKGPVSARDPGFASVTTDVGSAKRFSGKDGTLLELTLPAGHKALKLGGRWEAELLLPRDSEFKATGQRREGKLTIIEGHYLLPGESRAAGLGGQFAKGGGRVPARAETRKFVPGDEKDAMAMATAMYNGVHGSEGYRTEVTEVFIHGGIFGEDGAEYGNVQIDGRILAGDKEIGRFVSYVKPERPEIDGGVHREGTGFAGQDGSLAEVSHAFLELDSGSQGSGFSREFYGKAEVEYKKAGYHQVELTANIDVGGYCWARQGYKPTPNATAELHDRITQRRSKNRYSPEEDLTARDARVLRRFLAKGDMNGLATYKNSKGEPTGKTFLLGSTWNGVKQL